MRRYEEVFVLMCLIFGTLGKKPKQTEVLVVNECPLNIKLRCQSVLTDHSDRYVGPAEAFRFKFNDFELGNRHFWCDVYALNHFNETFDVYGGTSMHERNNLTWLLRPDGLYNSREELALTFSSWIHAPEIYLELNKALYYFN